jgi:hypothetical protein
MISENPRGIANGVMSGRYAASADAIRSQPAAGRTKRLLARRAPVADQPKAKVPKVTRIPRIQGVVGNAEGRVGSCVTAMGYITASNQASPATSTVPANVTVPATRAASPRLIRGCRCRFSAAAVSDT